METVEYELPEHGDDEQRLVEKTLDVMHEAQPLKLHAGGDYDNTVHGQQR